MLSRIAYYLSSLATILRGVRNWPAILTLPFRGEPGIVRLASGLAFKVRSVMDVWIIKETCLDRDYEVHGARIADGWTVIDIGAGIGEFTVLTARENPSSTVYAFEPFPESFALLRENLALNGLTNVVPARVAVSASPEATVRLAATGAAVQHTMLPNEITGEATAYVEVPSTTLGQLLISKGIERCDFLKIDCEGCEFAMLLRAEPSTLARIDRICLEYHDGFTAHSHHELIDFLQESGYSVVETPNPVHGYLGFLYAYRG